MTYCSGGDFEMYTSLKSSRCTSETNIMFNVSYASIKKKFTRLANCQIKRVVLTPLSLSHTMAELNTLL